MTLPDLDDIRYGDGIYSDPEVITALARQLNNANSRAVANSIVVKTSPGLLFGITVSSVAAQFIQVFNLTAVPAETTVPLLVFDIAALSTKGIAWVPTPRGFSNGIVICNSSTQHTKTIGSADCIFDVQFV